ncbi:MAG: hypothetical protein IT577_19395 [Verrucomicrobiae bacterium]|nr:hypothetical protein [Verrucomicrobiae bacterium]
MKTSVKIVIVAAVAILAVATIVAKRPNRAAPAQGGAASAAVAKPHSEGPLPRLLDLGSGKCVPCKMMTPILDQLEKEYAGRLRVEFIDVFVDEGAVKKYDVNVIPTQIFYGADGKELGRHEGFISKEDILAKWKELGVDLVGKPAAGIVREAPVVADARPRDAVCFMCDGDVDPKTKTLVKGGSEQRLLCSPHCYFIYFSSIPGADPAAQDPKVSVTDWAGGGAIPATSATYLVGVDAKGRPTVKAFADREAAGKDPQSSPGNLLTWEVLRSKELAARCGFCDRSVYPEDACGVTVEGGTRTYGCCTHCAMGVAARLGKDIEVEAKDGFSGEIIRIKTLNGGVASLDPPSAIAWFGQKKDAEGKWVSAGCFKQGFFVNEGNLQKWLDARPSMTGRQISIAQSLADKMKLTPQQIAKACKLGECK